MGVKWTSLAAGISVLGGIVQVWVLTRILTDSEFGTISVVNIAIGLSIQLVDMGFSNVLIREQSLSKKQMSSLFWMNVFSSFVLGFLVWGLTPLISIYYENPELLGLLPWVFPIFIVSSLGMQFQAIMNKMLRFKALASIEIISFLFSFITALTFAWQGFGTASLVISAFVKVFISTLFLIIIGSRYHRPEFHFKWSDIQPFWAFSRNQMAEKLIGFFSINLDLILIGRLVSTSELGIYDVVRRFLILPLYVINPVITKVSYPVMAQVHQDTPRLRNIALRALHLVAVINIPIYFAAAFGATFIVPVLLVSSWTSADEYFRWLSVYFIFRILLNPLGIVLVAKGLMNIVFWLQLVMFLGLSTAILIGSRYGITGILAGMVAFNVLLVIPYFYRIVRPTIQASWADLGRQLNFELIYAFLGFGTAFLIVNRLIWPDWIKLLVFGSLGICIYAVGILKSRPHLIGEIKNKAGYR